MDSNGDTLEMWLRNHRDTVSKEAFMKRLIRDDGQPRAIVTDKYAPSLKAINELKEEGSLMSQSITGSPSISIIFWNKTTGR
jgi:putative transposase